MKPNQKKTMKLTFIFKENVKNLLLKSNKFKGEAMSILGVSHSTIERWLIENDETLSFNFINIAWLFLLDEKPNLYPKITSLLTIKEKSC